MPEPLLQQDGTDKNDGERTAAKRFIVKRRQAHPHLKVLVTADRRRSNAPHIPVLPDHPLHSSLGVTEGAHAALFEQVEAAEHAGRVTDYDRDDAATGRSHRCRCVSDVPRTASPADLRGNVLECWEWDGDQGQHVRWVTDRRVTKGTVYQLRRGGRVRWRLENEPCKTLKNHGDHCEQNFGHGYQPLSVVVAVRRMLACLVDQVPQLCGPVCQAVWGTLGRKRRLWERRRALCDDYALDSRRH